MVSHHDERLPMSDITEKIRKLLDKASATEFAAEAESFMAAATRLMAIHDVSEAAVRAAGGAQSTEVINKTFTFSAPYAKGKMMIGHALANALDMKDILVVDNKSTKVLSVFGTKETLDYFESLHTSVSLHAVGEMMKARKPEWEHGRTFRASFLDGYGNRIGGVIRDARNEGRTEAWEGLTPEQNAGVGLVLRSDAERVEQAFTKAHPKTRTTTRSYTQGSGSHAGSRAAGNFSAHRGSVGGSRGALGA